LKYSDAIQYLYDLRWFGTKLGLTHTLKLAALAGDPHKGLRFIHVAGTNGKGSVCAMLESMYRASGLRVGLFTSPHLVSFRERFQVNRRQIPEADVVRLVSRLKALLECFPREEHPTFFEVITVMALLYFTEQDCELVIWETGLGGRLDATNIVTPLASVITNIQFDHEKWLGHTLAEIAGEKAGIIKPGVPVFTAATQPEVLEVIAETARRQNAAVSEVTALESSAPPLDTLDLPLAGPHQKINAALAITVARGLNQSLPLTPEHIRAGLSAVSWPGRLQRIVKPDGQTLILDGAHNVAGAEALALALIELFPGKSLTMILGILEDKNWADMCSRLAPLARRLLVVPVKSERTGAPQDLAAACRRSNPAAEISTCESLDQAMALCAKDKTVVIAGSLYLAGEALSATGLCEGSASRESTLNEWGDASLRSGARPEAL
jgi:dihydrofolate synthase/folylpolyglutamate synthase